MKHLRVVSCKPKPAQQTVFQVKLDSILFYVDSGLEYVSYKMRSGAL
jgi:hypothetical protein